MIWIEKEQFQVGLLGMWMEIPSFRRSDGSVDSHMGVDFETQPDTDFDSYLWLELFEANAIVLTPRLNLRFCLLQ